MYFVAFCDNWCSTVPESWVDKSKKVIKWPPKSENATTACKKGTNPKVKWQHVKYTKLLGPYDNYDIARQVEIAAVDLSTSDEASFINITKKKEALTKRPRKTPARYQKTSDDDSPDDDDTDKSSVIDEESNNNEKVSANDFNYKSIDNSQDDDLQETQPLDYGDFFEDPAYDHLKEKRNKNEKLSVRKIETVDKPINVIESNDNLKFTNLSSTNIVITENIGNDDNNNNINNKNNNSNEITEQESNPELDKVPSSTVFKKNGQKNTGKMNLPTNPAKHNDNINNQLVAPVCENCCPACRSKLEQISRKLDMVLMYVKSNKSTPTSSTNILNALPEFTVKDDTTLEELNKTLLENEEASAQYATIIRLRNVPDGKKHIREVLAFILDDKFSLKLSWSGQKKTIAVKGMAFVKLLTNTIVSCNPRCTLPELEGAIKTWLQHASDRLKYTADKHKPKD